MKTAAIPAVRVPPELRQAAEELLADGETLSGFVEDAVRRNVEYRQAQAAFVARGLASRDAARSSPSPAPASSNRPFVRSCQKASSAPNICSSMEWWTWL